MSPIREVELRFVEGATVSGQALTPDGQPAPGLLFRFDYETPYSHGFGGAELRTDRDGRFTFEHVNPAAPGEYSIRISDNPGYRPARIKIIPDGKPLTIRLQRGQVVSGVVVDDATRWPIPGVEVYAMPRDPSDGSEPLGYLNADGKTNERGEFRFTTMAAGEYSLHVREGQLAPASQNIRVTGGQSEPVTLRITLYQGTPLKPRQPATSSESGLPAEKAR